MQNHKAIISTAFFIRIMNLSKDTAFLDLLYSPIVTFDFLFISQLFSKVSKVKKSYTVNNKFLNSSLAFFFSLGLDATVNDSILSFINFLHSLMSFYPGICIIISILGLYPSIIPDWFFMISDSLLFREFTMFSDADYSFWNILFL